MKLDEIRLDRSHGGMVKFPSIDDRDFQKVEACLRIMIGNACIIPEGGGKS